MSLSLEELKNGTSEEKKGKVIETSNGTVRTFKPEEIGKETPVDYEHSIMHNMQTQMDILNSGVEASKERYIKEVVEPRLEAEAEAKLADEEEEEYSDNTNTESLENVIDDEDITDILAMSEEILNNPSNVSDLYKVEAAAKKELENTKTVSELVEVKSPEISDNMEKPSLDEIKEDLGKDFFDIDGDDEENIIDEDESEEDLENVKSQIKATIKPINNVVDFTKFTFSKKPASSASLLKCVTSLTKSADWVLFAAKKSITMSSLNGVELDHFNPRNISNARNRLNTYKTIYEIMYKHIMDENKPNTLEAWTKTIPFYDINHLYFAVYKACYADHNVVPCTCPSCNKTSMIEFPIHDMVKFDKDEVKEEFWKLYEGDSTSSGEYKAQLVQISDNFAAAIKLPTVYSVVFENAALDDAFLTKYSDLLGLISYIDALYLINNETMQLEEIKVKTEVHDFIKSTKRKIATYAKILNSLNSDQYNNFVALMKDLMDSNDGISYIQPKATCKYCGQEIDEVPVEPLDLVFTRHQLGAISNL